MIHERILEFLDGSLSHEEEAELLHTLSVSPEKRNLLRSYMNQKALFARDKETITVPYRAEQALWQRMAAVLPAATSAPVATEEVVLPLARNASFFGRLFTSASTAFVATSLVVGLGIGYLLGTNTTNTSIERIAATTPAVVDHPTATTAAAMPEIRYITKYVRVPVTVRPHNSDIAQSVGADIAQSGAGASLGPQLPAIASLAPSAPEAPVLALVGGDGGITPYFHPTAGLIEKPKTLLERFEFGVMEHLGREFPNSSATNSSMPIITNSAFNTFFQLSPNSSKYWAGLSVGTANMTKKTLYTRAGNSPDRLQDVLVADTVHTQSTYVAGYLQYRVPAFVGDMTFTAGYGLATLGEMIVGEIGLHYDISREVGIQFALRGMQFHYSLAAEREAAVKSGSGSLVIPKGVDQASPSFNLEVGSGLYFHF